MNITITQRVQSFIVENYLFGRDDRLQDDDSFLETGIIDSTGILELVSFLENEYSIRVESDELIPENLDSVNRISAYLRLKLSNPAVETGMTPPLHASENL